jgi:putative membrane protein
LRAAKSIAGAAGRQAKNGKISQAQDLLWIAGSAKSLEEGIAMTLSTFQIKKALATIALILPVSVIAQSASSLSSADKDFLENAAQSGHAEIEGSKMAQQKSGNAAVKTFADQMIQDHSKVAQELTTLAASKGYTPPSEPSVMQKTKLKALSVTSGATFDRMYASQIGVSAHEDAVGLFQKAATDAKDPDIKAFAAKTTPALEHHLEMAKALQKTVGTDK